MHLSRNQESLSHSRKDTPRHCLEIFPCNILEHSTESSQGQRGIMRDVGLFYWFGIQWHLLIKDQRLWLARPFLETQALNSSGNTLTRSPWQSRRHFFVVSDSLRWLGSFWFVDSLPSAYTRGSEMSKVVFSAFIQKDLWINDKGGVSSISKEKTSFAWGAEKLQLAYHFFSW